MRAYSTLLALLTITHVVTAQDYPARQYDLEKLAENIFPIQDLDIDYSQLYENLAQILSNPIDLNKATDEQLRSLYILNEIQIANLLQYRDEQGSLVSIYELQSIPGFDENTINKLIPFITLRSNTSEAKSLFQRILREQNKYLLIRYNRTLENKRGYTYNPSLSTNYNGSPDRVYSRFRVARSSDFSIGLTLEKDAGESFDWTPKNKKYGFDYNSFHFQVLNKGKLKNLTIGDYQAQFGQGLVLGGGFGVGKGAETITTVRRGGTGFLPYTSLNETGYFNGVAISVQPFTRLTIHSFVSQRHIDGSSQADSTNAFLSSFLSTGLHRTTAELLSRKTVLETNYGSVISYKHGSFELGSIFHHTNFSLPIIRNLTTYNQFYFNGSENTNTSFYLNYSWNNVAFFGEVAHTYHQGNAFVLGALASLTQHLDLAILYRKYDRNFQSFYGNAFSENTTVQNESGYYLGWKYKFNKQHALAGYTDLFQFPWLRYRGYAPSTGHEWLLRYSFQPSKSVFFYLQAREESKIRNHDADVNLYTTENGTKQNYWINLDYDLNSSLSMKSRVQFSTYDFEHQKTSGFALIQDVNVKYKKFSFSCRYALFDTDDYENRQYVYERDVWLAYSFPFYNGVGVRSYVLMQYAINKRIDLWVKWSRIQYEDKETIGTGSETIDGNSMNDVKLQARITF